MSSPAWVHFIKDGDKAKCKICLQELKCKQSTSGLLRHLHAKHRTVEEGNGVSEPPKKKKKTNDSNKSDLTDIIVDYALDGISFRTISQNIHLKKYVTLNGFRPPSCTRDVAGHIYSKAESLTSSLKSDIAAHLSKGSKFSLALDEGSTLRNRRYLNIILYFPNSTFRNLGVIRVVGSCPAEKLADLVEEKLREFSLNIKTDIAFVVSDGAPVMVKFARLIGCELQICYNHSIHLAVTDVFYKTKKTLQISTDEVDEDSSDEEGADEDVALQPTSDGDVIFDEKAPISELLQRCRRIVKLFKKSSVKNAVLQNFIVESQGKELSLLLDCPTRWNSLVPMLKRILEVRADIQNALDVLKIDGLSSSNLNQCKDIVQVLEPLEILVKSLSKRSTTILGSEAAIICVFEHLENMDSELADEMLTALKNRLGSSRRNDKIVSMAKFFHDPENYSTEQNNFFKPIPRTELEKEMLKLLKKLERDKSENEAENENEEDNTETSSEVGSCSFAETLKNKMLAFCKPKDYSKKSSNRLQTLRKELKYLEVSGNLPSSLKCLKSALMSIPPSSIEPERTFSLCEFFVTKRRSRFSDKIINALIFIKSHLKKSTTDD